MSAERQVYLGVHSLRAACLQLALSVENFSYTRCVDYSRCKFIIDISVHALSVVAHRQMKHTDLPKPKSGAPGQVVQSKVKPG